MSTLLFTVHLYRNFRTHHSAESASSARFLDIFCGVVSLFIEALGDANGLVWTDSDTQLTGLA